MIDLKLDTETHDVVVTDGDLELVADGAEVAQSCKIRLWFILGEWILDVSRGLDWFGYIFPVYTSIDQKNTRIKKMIRETEGVRAIKEYTIAIDPVNHASQIDFSVDTEFGDVQVRVGP